MASVFRAAAAIVAGLLVAFVFLIAVELFSAAVHPLPAGFGGTKDEMCQHVERYPNWVLAIVVPAWAGTALASAWLAGRIGNRECALVVGVLLLAAQLFNLSMLPYPIWFKAANLIAIPCAVVFAAYLSSRAVATA
jgi:hypothetical protein